MNDPERAKLIEELRKYTDWANKLNRWPLGFHIAAALTELDERGLRIEELEKQVAALRADYNHAELARYRGIDRAGGVSND